MNFENSAILGKSVVHNTLVVFLHGGSTVALTSLSAVKFVPMETDLLHSSHSLQHFRKRFQKQWPGGNMKYSYSHYVEALTNVLIGVCFLLKVMHTHPQTCKPCIDVCVCLTI